VLRRNFLLVDEIRYAVDIKLPPAINILPPAKVYYVSPIFIGDDRTQLGKGNVGRCIKFVKRYPTWRLSLQMHKIIDIK